MTAAQFEDAEGRELVEAIHERHAAQVGRIGDKIGYVLRQEHAGGWVTVDGMEFDNITDAVRLLEDYQEEDPNLTFAVGRIELIMISRPPVTVPTSTRPIFLPTDKERA